MLDRQEVKDQGRDEAETGCVCMCVCVCVRDDSKERCRDKRKGSFSFCGLPACDVNRLDLNIKGQGKNKSHS